MPSTSLKQQKFMRAVAHNPEFAAKVSVPVAVGQEFAQADKAKRLAHHLRQDAKRS